MLLLVWSRVYYYSKFEFVRKGIATLPFLMYDAFLKAMTMSFQRIIYSLVLLSKRGVMLTVPDKEADVVNELLLCTARNSWGYPWALLSGVF